MNKEKITIDELFDDKLHPVYAALGDLKNVCSLLNTFIINQVPDEDQVQKEIHSLVLVMGVAANDAHKRMIEIMCDIGENGVKASDT